MNITRRIGDPRQQKMSVAALWHGPDRGLIACWERGRDLTIESPQLASAARRGELVVLPWKGGVAKELKSRTKVGSLRYLAMWQGLRGTDLDIDTDKDTCVKCSRHGVVVTFTPDEERVADA